MKRIVCFLILSVFSTSCTSIWIPTATATLQPTVTFTPTFIPTLTPSITPTPTNTPTPTETPPPDAMGRNSSTGEYTKTVEENGRKVSYVWKQIQFGSDVENGVTGHWFESRMVKGQPIDFIGYGENCRDEWGKITLNLNVYSVEGFQDLDKVGFLYHPDEPSYYKSKGYLCNTFSSTIGFDLFLRYSDLVACDSRDCDSTARNEKFWEKYNAGPGKTMTDADRGRMYNDWQAFVKAINQGAGIRVGDDLWQPRKGYDVYWIDEASAKSDPTMQFLTNLYWKLIVKDGKLIAIVAPDPWMSTQLSWYKAGSRESMFRLVILFPLQTVLTTSSMPHDVSWASYQDYEDYASMAGNITSIDGQSIAQFIAFAPDP